MNKINGQLKIEIKSELTTEVHNDMGDFKKQMYLEVDVREEKILKNLPAHIKLQPSRNEKATSNDITNG